MLGDRPTWQDDAACKDIDTVIFFPTNPRASAKAMKFLAPICEACPVRQACLDFAMSFGDKQLTGIWAATTERERQRRRHYNTINHGTKAGYRQELFFGLDTCDLCRQANLENTLNYKMPNYAVPMV